MGTRKYNSDIGINIVVNHLQVPSFQSKSLQEFNSIIFQRLGGLNMGHLNIIAWSTPFLSIPERSI